MNKGPQFLLVEAQLSKKILSHYKEFNRTGIFEILNGANKSILNMIPHRFSYLLQDDMKNNLFDNLELLEG
jgi:hypothetical protein